MNKKQLPLFLNHHMKKTGVGIALLDPSNTGLLTQKNLLTEQGLLQPVPSLRKSSSVIDGAKNIIQSLLLGHVLLLLLDLRANIAKYIIVPSFQVELQANELLLKGSHVASSRSTKINGSNMQIKDNRSNRTSFRNLRTAGAFSIPIIYQIRELIMGGGGGWKSGAASAFECYGICDP